MDIGKRLEKIRPLCMQKASYLLGNKIDSEDVVQNVFYKYLKSGKSIEDESYFVHYLCRATHNECLSVMRRRIVRRGTCSLESIKETEVVEDNALEYVMRQTLPLELDVAYKSLNYQDRRILDLAYREKKSMQEIADELETTSDAVRTRLKRARNTIREQIKKG